MSADPLGDLVAIYIEGAGVKSPILGAKVRAGVAAVEKAVNHRWLDMLPAGSLMCGCGDIVPTDHQCENCDAADRSSLPAKEGR